MTPGEIGDFGAACDLFARAVKLYTITEGMKAENAERQRADSALAYPESAFVDAMKECGFEL